MGIYKVGIRVGVTLVVNALYTWRSDVSLYGSPDVIANSFVRVLKNSLSGSLSDLKTTTMATRHGWASSRLIDSIP